ncbi:MAG: hypothetical protein ACXVCP_02130 [Bdellovibrio sp.]
MKKYLTTLFFIFIIAQAKAANHFVREGATGSASGNDWVNAYTSLPINLIRGDTYYIAAGNYPGRSFTTPNSGTSLISIKKAIESDHGTDSGWQTTYGTGQAVFNGMLEFASSYWIFDGMTGGGAGSWDSGFGFKIIEKNDTNAMIRIGFNTSDIGNIILRHIEFQGKGSGSNSGGYYSNDALALYFAHNVTLSYASMQGIGRCPFFFGEDNVGPSLFEHIYVQSYFASDAVHAEVMSTGAGGNATQDTTFRYSLVTDIEGTGGLMWSNESTPTTHLWVYGNIFYRPSGVTWSNSNGVIGGWTGANGEGMHNLIVYNNTFINVDGQPLSSLPNLYSGNVAYNNIFYNSPAPDFSKFATHDYNYFINSGDTASELHGISAASGDPFVNYVGFDFRLKADTAAGISLSSPYNLDPLGTVRGVSGTFDRGAFQFQSNGGSTVLFAPTNLRVK